MTRNEERAYYFMLCRPQLWTALHGCKIELYGVSLPRGHAMHADLIGMDHASLCAYESLCLESIVKNLMDMAVRRFECATILHKHQVEHV